MKKALITGISGQDGSYLAELLLSMGYDVHGVIRRKASRDFGNSSHLQGSVQFHFGNLSDPFSLMNILIEVRPDEVYNLAAQSFVGLSWHEPQYTTTTNALGVLSILEGIKKFCPEAKFYQASTSEMYGGVHEVPQNEKTPFYPKSPYGVAKLYAHWMSVNYRESFGMFNCNGILFNHESERRGIEFVTRKITAAVAEIHQGRKEPIELGNLSAMRDWGHSEDYVRGMWLMLQQDRAEDYILASGEAYSVRDFAEKAFQIIGRNIEWNGNGENEVGMDIQTGKVIVKVNKEFYRPAEVDILLGDPSKAINKLGWKRMVSFDTLVERMVINDIKLLGVSL